MFHYKIYSETGLYTAFSRAIAIDFPLQKIMFYPPELISSIISGNTTTGESLHNEELDKRVEACINDLIREKILFKTAFPESFPSVNFLVDTPAHIECIHIQVSMFIIENFEKVLKCIEYLKVLAIKIDLRNCSQSQVKKTLLLLTKSSVESIECVFDFEANEVSVEFLKEILIINRVITYLNIYNLPENFEISFDDNVSFIRNESYFPKLAPSFKLYTESQQYHTYFNKKLFIDSEGTIKNAPETREIFGNLKNVYSFESILAIVNSIENKKYWFVKKDNCDVCQSCEFRHICIDNRIPIARESDEWYFEIECNFNPYITKWSHEEGYLTLSECGVISNEKGFSIDHNRIAEINFKLWSDE